MVFHLGMRLDHLSYAAPIEHLAETVQRLGAALGAPFTDGGLHPGFGTRNFILPLAGGTYIEVVSALDHPAAESPKKGARGEVAGIDLRKISDLESLRLVITKLRGEMKKASVDLEFERAATLRDKVRELEQLELQLR